MISFLQGYSNYILIVPKQSYVFKDFGKHCFVYCKYTLIKACHQSFSSIATGNLPVNILRAEWSQMSRAPADFTNRLHKPKALLVAFDRGEYYLVIWFWILHGNIDYCVDVLASEGAWCGYKHKQKEWNRLAVLQCTDRFCIITELLENTWWKLP